MNRGHPDLTSLRFFGLGPTTSSSNRTTYRLEDRTFEMGLNAWKSRFAELGAGVQWLTTEPGHGASGVSLDNQFDPLTTPGF